MKSLEQDALRAQMVLSRSQEGRGMRGPLERLAEAPSPAPTPSPTPLEGPWVRAGGGVSLLLGLLPTPASCPPRPRPPDQHLPGTPGEEPVAMPSLHPQGMGGVWPAPTPVALTPSSSHSLPLPSRCPFKPLSGKKFDYRAFAALPSSRPVYDIQVPGLQASACLPPCPCLPPPPSAPAGPPRVLPWPCFSIPLPPSAGLCGPQGWEPTCGWFGAGLAPA